MNYSQNDINLIGLSLVKGIGYGTISKIKSYFGSFDDFFKKSIKDLKKIGISDKICNEIFSKNYFKESEILIENHIKKHIDIVTFENEKYSKRLSNINDPAIVLFCKGNYDLNLQKIVAIVGTRNISQYSKKFINEFIESIKDENLLIVSGFAYGVDIEVHKACIKNNIKITAIFGGGIENVYPKDHIRYIKELEKSGGIVSEYSSDIKVESYRFVERNRIIAGISDATFVVEAPMKSGALLTAKYANDYNREVFALPGSVFEKNFEGCHNLIKKNSARILTCCDDLFFEMNWNDKKNIKEQKIDFEKFSMDEEELMIYKTIKDFKNKIHIDEILTRLENLEINKVLSILLEMEMQDIIISFPGKYYQVI
jgi:DNA processing protein